jgi:hypothetical protein
MADCDGGTTPDVIWPRIVDRLIDQITTATTSTCYLSLDPNRLPSPNPGEFIYVVTPAVSGQFDEGAFDGGGPDMATVRWPVVVTVHSIAMNDESGRDAEFIANATRGIVAKGTEVVKALAGHDLQDEEAPSQDLLAQPIFPDNAALDRDNPQKGSGLIQFGFMVIFDWNLS